MKNMCEGHQILWTVTLNDKWQIVIPIDARKRLWLKPGDQLMLIAKWDIALWLVSTANLQALISMLQEEMNTAQAK
jgi:AbrB family looped-hinge helix DNA binding protein